MKSSSGDVMCSCEIKSKKEYNKINYSFSHFNSFIQPNKVKL